MFLKAFRTIKYHKKSGRIILLYFDQPKQVSNQFVFLDLKKGYDVNGKTL